MSKLGQESAFPGKTQIYSEVMMNKGMSKRFYDACAAMEGLLRLQAMFNSKEELIRESYAIADELLKQEIETNKE
jgi:hypothetical protein